MQETIDRVLAMETWAIVGLSDNPARAAWEVSKFLQDRGKRIVPIHPIAPMVHEAQGFASLDDVPFPIDVVDCFVRSDLVGEVIVQAIAVGAKGVWMQLGVIDRGAAARATTAGLAVVMDRCPRIEWRG